MTPPNSKDRSRIVTTLLECAEAARAAILPHFRTTIPVDNKAGSGFDPVTQADRGAEEAIRALIQRDHPTHEIIGEEFGHQDGSDSVTWVIDPVDGTRAFIAGAPTWGTLIGVGIDGRPVFGLFDQGFTGDRVLGVPGLTLDLGSRGPRTLQASSTARVEEAILAATAPDMFKTADQKQAFGRVSDKARLTRFGMDCTAYVLLASGHIDLVIEANLKIYDIYALIPIIEGAGGVVTDWTGGPAHNGGTVLAAATPELHAEALALLSA